MARTTYDPITDARYDTLHGMWVAPAPVRSAEALNRSTRARIGEVWASRRKWQALGQHEGARRNAVEIRRLIGLIRERTPKPLPYAMAAE